MDTQKSRIAHYVATLMSDHNLENRSMILTAGDSSNPTKPHNGICKNEIEESCSGTNRSCENYYGNCGGSSNSTECHNVVNTNIKTETCGGK